MALNSFLNLLHLHQSKFRRRLSLLLQRLIRIPRSILPQEKDGVSPDGTPVYDGDASSCWSKPLDPPILGQYPIANGGTCRVCVIQNGTGQEPDNVPSYAMWVRDDKNHAIGGIDPFPMAPSLGPPNDVSQPPSGVSFSVGATSLNVWSSLPDEREKYVTVYMVWDKPAGWNGPETMRFDTDPGSSMASNNCTVQGATSEDAVTWFQCQFHC